MTLFFLCTADKDSSKTALPGGGVHPLTRYVMNYLVFLSDYSGSVADIVADWPLPVQKKLPASYFSSPVSVGGADSPGTALSVRLAWIILLLLCKLDGKAGLNKEHVALSYVFLANNFNYARPKSENVESDSSIGDRLDISPQSKDETLRSKVRKDWVGQGAGTFAR